MKVKIISILKSKAGLTLVELITAALLMGIVIAAAGTMLISGGLLFADSARRNEAEMVGDSCIAVIEKRLLYAKELSLYDVPPDGAGRAVVSVFDGLLEQAERGQIFIKESGSPDFSELFSEAFYKSFEVSIGIKAKEDSNIIEIEIYVYEDGIRLYHTGRTITLLNADGVRDYRAEKNKTALAFS